MGVSIKVREGEAIDDALKRFRSLVRRFGPPGAVKPPKWHKNQLRYYLKPNERRRRDRLRDEWQRVLGAAQDNPNYVASKVRGRKRRKSNYRV